MCTKRTLSRLLVQSCDAVFTAVKLKFVVYKNVKRKQEMERVSSVVSVHTFMSNTIQNNIGT